jgi:hypothetical protein
MRVRGRAFSMHIIKNIIYLSCGGGHKCYNITRKGMCRIAKKNS